MHIAVVGFSTIKLTTLSCGLIMWLVHLDIKYHVPSIIFRGNVVPLLQIIIHPWNSPMVLYSASNSLDQSSF
jgi:hypothetical protein